MSTSNEQAPMKKGRGRPSKNNNSNNSNVITQKKNNVTQKTSLIAVTNSIDPDEQSTNTTATNVKRKSIVDTIFDTDSDQTISSELQNLAIEQFGQDVFQKAFEMSQGSLSIFCSFMNIFRIYKLKKPNAPIPLNWYIDDYWMYSPDERVEMLNAAFTIQDDDADLKNTVEGEFKCSACKSKRIRLKLRQIRSSDEPMSQYFKCADCKKEWVIH
jgi:DNA-directed RNA polymerase subunit M/transcription elongation factor TFIIS